MKRILDLLAKNDGRGAGLKAAASGDTATIHLYDAIGGWFGVSAKAFAETLAGVSARNLHLCINSPGGDVFEARAIKTQLERWPGDVRVTVDGLAASAASVVMLAGDTIEIAKGAFVMIHNPWSLAMGDAREMRATADLLDSVRDSLVDDYVKASGQDRAAISAMMDAETWMEAEEAVAKGFCATVVAADADDEDKAQALGAFDVSAYARAPKALKEFARPAARKTDVDSAFAAERERYQARLRLYEKAA